MKYTIYCDMDGVLVDFDKQYQKLTGHLPEVDKDDLDKFWTNIKEAGEEYWFKMEWMPDGKQLWNYLKQFKPILLSAPSREPESSSGKIKWVKENIPGTPLILKPAYEKKDLAGFDKILIDDNERNINEWEEEGGIGILHINANNTIKELEKILNIKSRFQELAGI